MSPHYRSTHTSFALFMHELAEMAGWNVWTRALYKIRPQLEERLNIDHHISSLHEAVPGGFLTSMEEDDIMSQSTKYHRVRKFIEILASKDRKAVEAFAAILKAEGQIQLAEELVTEAQQDESQDMSSNTCTGAEKGPIPLTHTSSQSHSVSEATPTIAMGDQQTLMEDEACIPAATVQTDALAKLKKRNELGAKLFRILVVGEQGSGKSTLIRNLFAVQVKGSCGELRNYPVAAEECPLSLYISYGFEDADKHVKTIEQLVNDGSLSLVIYCLPINDIRLFNRFFDTIKKHSEIGVKWDRTLLVLTFADMLPVPRLHRKQQDFDGGAFFMQKKEDWVREIKRKLLDKAVLSESAFNTIRIHSTTEHSTVPLPNGRDWYGPLWADILDISLPSTMARS